MCLAFCQSRRVWLLTGSGPPRECHTCHRGGFRPIVHCTSERDRELARLERLGEHFTGHAPTRTSPSRWVAKRAGSARQALTWRSSIDPNRQDTAGIWRLPRCGELGIHWSISIGRSPSWQRISMASVDGSDLGTPGRRITCPSISACYLLDVACNEKDGT